MNRTITSILAISILLTLCATSVSAQRRGHHKEKMVERLTEQLGLSDDQNEQVRDIMSSARAACRDSDDFDSKRDCMKSQKDSMHEQINSVLNEEQQVAFGEITQLVDEIGHRGYGIYSRLQEISDVTDEQLAAVKEVFSQTKTTCQAATSKSEMRECRHSQRDSVRSELESILSEEQLEAIRPPRPPRDF